MSPVVDIVSKFYSTGESCSDTDRFLLVRHPKVMQKLRSEISAACVDIHTVTREDLRKLPYLQKVLKESGAAILHSMILCHTNGS